jgi:hypothetical protein
VLANTSSTFELSRCWIQDRLRLIESTNKARDTIQHEEYEQNINDRSPQQQSKQTARNPKYEARYAPRRARAGVVDESIILVHDGESGGYA